MTDMLSPHISRAEFQHSETAIALAIANVMPEALVPAGRALCVTILEPVRAHFGVPLTLNSGYRSGALNRVLGSRESSQHRRGEAADIEMPNGPSNAELALWIRDSGLPFDQLILEAIMRGRRDRAGCTSRTHCRARNVLKC